MSIKNRKISVQILVLHILSTMEEKKKKYDRGTAARIDIRLDPKLKEALDEYCSQNYETKSNVIKAAIKKHIGYDG